ncbi:MAG TPA: UbiA family prenyltransferase [Thermoplasmata archaeon]|nr:UbiA family prenyltransferase [Thermoplasmata archaeon]
MRAYVRLLRPVNALMSALAVWIGAIVAVGWDVAVSRAPAVALGSMTTFLFTGAGNALNDFYDRDVDRVNHPKRPIPAGEIAPAKALDAALLLFALSVLLAIFINAAALALVILSLFLMIAYETRFKASGWSGNLLIAWLVGSLFLFAGLCVYRGATAPLQIAASLAVLAGLSNVGREIVKDIEDVAGDTGRTTLPKRRGVPYAGRAAQGFLVTAVVLSAAPAALGLLSMWYVPIVAVADAVFIYAALYATRSPRRSERSMKVAMVLALLAFLAGGLS